jgi:D-threonate/D-erythronate kinase
MSSLAGTTPLTIIADDLTGALDTAGPFASTAAPVAVVLGDPENSCGSAARLASSTETRDLERTAATAAARATAKLRLDRVGRQGVWFKKVDSVLRGHPFDEIVAIADAAGFERIVFAPAFPEQGRRTVHGRQEAQTANGWAQVGEDLVAGFRARGIAAALRSSGNGWPDERVAVLDASDPADLDRIAIDLMPLLAAELVLVAGCGGLAEAMAGRPPPQASAPPDLLLIGSPHPVMKEQIVRAAGRVIVSLAAPEATLPPRSGGLPLLVVADKRVTTRASADQCFVWAIERLVERGVRPKRLFVSGGATLSLVAIATGSKGIVCTGRIAPGLPCSRLVEGAWDGCEVTSKSGGFGGKDLLKDLLR